MNKKPTQFFFLIFLLSSIQVFAQSNLAKFDQNRTLLQVSSGFYTVEKNATVDLDSSLLITSQSHKLSRVPVITEEIDDSYTSKNCHWMDKGNGDSVRKALTKLRGLQHARLTLLLGAYYAFHPGFQTRYVDSGIFYLTLAKKELDQLKLTGLSLQCSCLLGKCYFKRNDIPAGVKWFKNITDNEKQNPDQRIIAKAWNYEGMYCPFLASTTIFRIQCLNKALIIFEKLKDTSNQINTLMNISYMSVANRDIKKAQDVCNRSLFLQKSAHFPYTQYTYDLLAFYGYLQSDFAKTLNFGLESIKSANATKDNLALGHFYFRVAEAYEGLQDHDEQLSWMKKALTEYEKEGGDSELYLYLGIMPISNIETGKDFINLVKKVLKKYPPKNPVDRQYAYIALAKSYTTTGKFKIAENYYKLAEQLNQYTPLYNGGINNHTLTYEMGSFYLETKDFKKSKFYFSKLLTDAYKNRLSKDLLGHTYYNLHTIDSISGNYRSSLNYLNKYTDLQNAIYSESQSKQLTDLNVKYETSQREKDLQLLKVQNQLDLQRESSTRKFAYIGFVVLFLVIIMIYSRYYFNKKSNNLLKIQKDEIDEQNHSLQNFNKQLTTLNNQQEKLLTEKEWLLKEIHHRVKNNLQTTMSLLKIQSAYINNDEAREAIRNSQRRMHAMALIHQQLYQSDTIAYIDMSKYINELVRYLKESFSLGYTITYNLQVKPLTLEIGQAVPMGLIINEAVTNAIKYAFPDHNTGTISIFFDQDVEGTYKLCIADDGIGLPETFVESSKKSLGMNLMRGLTDQLGGKMTIKKDNGTQLLITFEVSKVLTDNRPIGDKSIV